MCCGKPVRYSPPPDEILSGEVDYDDSQDTLIALAQSRFKLNTLRIGVTMEGGNKVRLYREEYDALVADGAPILLL